MPNHPFQNPKSSASERGTKSEVAPKWAWWLHHPCRLGGPQRLIAGDKIRSGPHEGLVAALPLPSRGPTRGRKCYITPPSSGVPKQGNKIRSSCNTHAFSGATSGRKCCISPAFWGVPKQGDKIGSGCHTPAFLGGHKWAQVLRNPCILGSPNKWTKSEVAASPAPCQGTKIRSGISKKVYVVYQKKHTSLLFSVLKRRNSLIFFLAIGHV